MKPPKNAEGMSASERRAEAAKHEIKAEAKAARQRTGSLREQRLTQELAKADRDVSEGEEKVAEQQLRIEELQSGGFDATEAEALLQSLERHLAEWHARRDDILRQLRFLAGK